MFSSLGVVASSHPRGAAGEFSPADLSGLAGWWDASDADTFTYSSGVLVSEWRDKSGNARHLAQSDTALQPSRNGTQNGLSTVIFLNDTLDTSSFTLAQPLTLIYVVNTNASVDQGVVSSVGGSLQTYIAMSRAQMRMFAGSEATAATDPPAVTGVQQWSFTFNGSSSSAWQNGTLEGSALNPGTAGTTTGLRISERNTANRYRGDVMEITAYSGALDTSDRQSVESYLKTKWGTP